MSSDPPLSRYDLVELTGVPHDVLTFWLRHNLLEPIGGRAGRGKGLKFEYYEANIAAIMMELRNFGANIDAMKGIAGLYREAIAWAKRHDLDFDELMAIHILINGPVQKQTDLKVKTGTFDVDDYKRDLDAIRDGVEGRFKITDKVENFVYNKLSVDAYSRYAVAAAQILSRPSGQMEPVATYFWRTAVGWRRGDNATGQLRASSEGAFATIALDVLNLLAQVWTRYDHNQDALAASQSSEA